MSPSGKATDSDSVIRRFESYYPCHYDPLAQLAEHLTFNQGVPRSSRGWITKNQLPFERTGVFLFQSSYSTGCDSLLISIRKSSPDKYDPAA